LIGLTQVSEPVARRGCGFCAAGFCDAAFATGFGGTAFATELLLAVALGAGLGAVGCGTVFGLTAATSVTDDACLVAAGFGGAGAIKRKR
tara:strand:- start:122 stop:391 length:270 start_codon:yes stop_codon:yes gene_type:complete